MSNADLRVMLYSHNTRGMGHAARLVNIAWGLYNCMPEASILCCTGGMYGLANLLPPNADFVKVPSFDAREEEGTFRLFPARLKVSRSRLISIRRNILTAVARSFRPHVLISDYTPLGKDRELEGAIRLIHRKPNRLIILGLRDILNDPERAERFLSRDVCEPVRQYFDRVFIYGDPTIYDFFNAYPIPPDVRSKFEMVGYLVNPTIQPDLNRDPAARGIERKVIAGVGGGKDALDILMVIINAWKQTQPTLPFPCSIHIITGPYIRDEQWQQVVLAVRDLPTVQLTRELPAMAKHLTEYDLFIGACGYNAFAEVLQAGIRAVFLPRSQVDSQEQVIRARHIQSDSLYEVVEPGQDAEMLLAQKMAQLLIQKDHTHAVRREVSLDGAAQTANQIKHWWLNRKVET